MIDADKPRVLVVLAARTDAEHVKRAVERAMPVDVLLASTFSEAMVTARTKRPAAAVVDLSFKSTSDLLVSHLRATLGASFPIIVISAQANAVTEALVADCMPEAWLLKPLEVDALVRALADTLYTQRQS